MQVKHKVEIEFKLAHKTFKEKFLVLETANSIRIGNPFFVKHDISVRPSRNILQVDDLSKTINEIKP